MGRLKRKNKSGQRRKARKEVRPPPIAPVSDPESRGGSLLKGEEAYSSCTNSCEEGVPSLCADHHTGCDGADPASVRLLRSPADEMEVTHRLSCLNFSMDPCERIIHAPHHLPSLGFEVLSDLEGCSELASTAQGELLPTLSDRGEGAEDTVTSQYRRARKRTSRRKHNRRSKKFRCVSSRDTPFVKAGSIPTATSQLEPGGVARIVSRETSSYGSGSVVDGSSVTGTRSVRKAKRSQQARHEDDPLLYCLSDTSLLDADTASVYSGQMEGVETTPPSLDDTLMSDDTLVMEPESELSETTSDSGCEGDDEESSVEGPVPPLSHSLLPQAPLRLSANSENSWWVSQDLEDHTFQQILAGSFPLLTPAGRHKVTQACGDTPRPEFKHPGRFGPCGRGRKKRCKPSELSSPLTLRDINEKIIAFVQDQCVDRSELKFSLVSRALCKTIAALAKCYQLECVIEQKRRLPVASPCLRRTVYTRLATLQEIEPILRQHGDREHLGVSPLVSNLQRKPRSIGTQSTWPVLPTTPPSTHVVMATAQSPRPIAMPHPTMPPRLVVSPQCQVTPAATAMGYQPLDETNIGNRMLQNMGWRPGVGLGVESDGITSPVKAYFRTRHTAGLGFN